MYNHPPESGVKHKTKMKRYITYDACAGEFNSHDTIEEAREHLKGCFFDIDDRVYHPDTADCQIFELKEVVKVEVIDKKSNYEYEYEDDIPEGEDGEAWPYSSECDEIWDVKFEEVTK
jgi:hypothetical protein